MNSTHRAARPRRGQALAMVAAAALLTAGPAAHAQTAATEQVQVRSFQVQGNTLLDGAAVQAALVPYTGARSLADLQRAAQAVQALYGQERGAVPVAADLAGWINETSLDCDRTLAECMFSDSARARIVGKYALARAKLECELLPASYFDEVA